jgi:predicted GNAT family acetyltransferase
MQRLRCEKIFITPELSFPVTEIIHRPEQGKFLIRLAPGAYAFLGYELRDGKMYIKTTYTPPEFRGRGIATRLMEHAVRWAEQMGYKVVPICSFAVHYFKKHEEWQRVLDEEGIRELGDAP